VSDGLGLVNEYMTVYFVVISLPNILYIQRICMVLASPMNELAAKPDFGDL
jgi:hypothetical protein